MKIYKIELDSEEIIEMEKYLANQMFNKNNYFDFKIVHNVYIKIQEKQREITKWIE